MLDRLIDIVASAWARLLPWVVIDPWERGVVVRLGQFHRDLDPGFHWRIPFVEIVAYDTVVPDTHQLAAQPLTTSDGQQISVQAVLLYQIRDLKKLLLVGDRERALHDTAAGLVAQHVAATPWAEIGTEASVQTVFRSVRQRGFRYGIEVQELQFTGLQKSRSYMLLQNHKYE